MRLSKLALFGCVPFMLCFSHGVFAHTVDLSEIMDKEASCHHHSHRCHGSCPLTAPNYTPGKGSRVELKIDDLLVTNPVPTAGTPAALAGFADYLGFDTATTEAYWRLGLDYIDCRFGIDTTNVVYDQTTGIAFLTVLPDGTAVQTPFPDAGTNVIITPLTFTGSGAYRCVEDTSDTIYTKPWCRPFVRLAEFVVTFIGEVNLRGTYAQDATGEPDGVVTVSSGGVAFGRYVIRGKDGYDRYFDMRSWIPNKAEPSGGEISYFTERFQIHPLDPDEFGGSGIGTLTIIAPTGAVDTPDGPRYRWYIRNDWWFGPIESWPQVVDWDSQCGNLSTILPTGRFAEKCNDVPLPPP